MCAAASGICSSNLDGSFLSDRRIQKIVPVYVLPPENGEGIAIGADYWVEIDLRGKAATRIVTIMSGRSIKVPSSEWDEFVESHRLSAIVKAESMMGRDYWG